MFRSNTRGIVTVVENPKPIGNLSAMCNLPREDMCRNPSALVLTERAACLPIAINSATHPLPTSVPLPDSAPKARDCAIIKFYCFLIHA